MYFKACLGNNSLNSADVPLSNKQTKREIGAQFANDNVEELSYVT